MASLDTIAQPKPLDLTRVGFERSDLATPAGRMSVFSHGDGPPLLLLHGIGGGASSYYWARLAPLLAKEFSVSAPDFVGWGDSEHPARPLLFADYVDQIVSLLETLGPTVAIAGQGLAAGFALAALKGRAKSVAPRLTLLAPTGGRDFGKDAFDPVFAWTLSVLARSPWVNMALYRRYFHRRGAYEFWFRRRGFFDATKVPDDLIDSGLRSGTKPNAAYAALPFVAGSLRYDLAPLLRAIDRPALMLWGEHEAQIKPAIRARLAACNPLIRQAIIPDTRSNFESEAPVRTADLMIAFLKNTAP